MRSEGVLEAHRLVAPKSENLYSARGSDDRPVQVTAALLADTLKRIRQTDPALEDLAIFHLWWRASLLFKDVCTLKGSGAPLAMTFVARAVTECDLQATLILGRTGSHKASSGPFDHLLETESSPVTSFRLRGYLAWLLSNEIWYLDQTVRPKRTKAIFEAETARRQAAELKETAQEFPGIYDLFDDPETMTDAEVEVDRKAYIALKEEQRRQVKRLYEHDALREWKDKISKRGRGPISLIDLLENDSSARTGIGRSWQSLGLGIFGIWYDEASALMHGHRLAPLNSITSGGEIAPSTSLLGAGDDIERTMVSGILVCASNLATVAAAVLGD